MLKDQWEFCYDLKGSCSFSRFCVSLGGESLPIRNWKPEVASWQAFPSPHFLGSGMVPKFITVSKITWWCLRQQLYAISAATKGMVRKMKTIFTAQAPTPLIIHCSSHIRISELILRKALQSLPPKLAERWHAFWGFLVYNHAGTMMLVCVP